MQTTERDTGHWRDIGGTCPGAQAGQTGHTPKGCPYVPVHLWDYRQTGHTPKKCPYVPVLGEGTAYLVPMPPFRLVGGCRGWGLCVRAVG